MTSPVREVGEVGWGEGRGIGSGGMDGGKIRERSEGRGFREREEGRREGGERGGGRVGEGSGEAGGSVEE